MSVVRWSRPALADYRAILSRIREANPRAAERIADAVKDRLRLLSAMPRLGREGRLAGTRELVIGGTPYIVIYELIEDSNGDEAIFVLRVLHGARRWPPQ